LKKLKTDPRIEILLTDINMPDMNGYALAEVAVLIRKPLKVILLSGREGAGRGFPLIRKPFMKDDLVQTMSRYTGLC
jgi:CheY-like chemotaxis protein